jgi:tetratricopeptide (TPR) repeat protein
LKAAESSFVDALQIRKNGLGDNHPDTRYTEGKFAAFYYKHGKYAEAEQHFNSALKIQKALPDSPELAQALCGLGRLYTDQGKYVEAEPLFKQALAIQEKAIPGHPDFADTLDAYAALLSKTDRQAAADEMRNRAQRVRQIHSKENPVR